MSAASSIPRCGVAFSGIHGTKDRRDRRLHRLAGRRPDRAWTQSSDVLEPQVHGPAIAAPNSCLATIGELAVAAQAPGKDYHHTVLLGHSFGALVLGNTISHSILGANGEGGRSSSAWDMAVAFNSADSSITTRQLMSELDYLYRYDPQKRAYVSRAIWAKRRPLSAKTARPWSFCNRKTIRQPANSSPSGKESSNLPTFTFIGKKCRYPGITAKRSRKANFIPTPPATTNTWLTTTSFRLANRPAAGSRATENRAFEANIKQNHPDFSFYTSEHNDGHERQLSVRNGEYTPVPSIHRREKKFGGSGSLNIPAMPASLVGSCACPRTLSGVTEDCGATIRSRCSARSFEWNSRSARGALWLFPSRGPLQSPPTAGELNRDKHFSE